MGSKTTAPIEPSPPKPKPKASTPLRRTASASLPIRANPTPTRGSIQPVFTLTTAERYALSRLGSSSALPLGARIFQEAYWVPKWGSPGKEGEIFIFSNGSFVCWGLGETEAERFKREVIRNTADLEIVPLKEDEAEDLEYVTDPNEQTRLQGDLIILGATAPLSDTSWLDPLIMDIAEPTLPLSSLPARYAFSQALARSTALSALETSLEEFLQSVSLLPHSLTKTGRPSLGRQELIKKLGQLLRFRQHANLNRENFGDTPDFYWTEPVLEEYFHIVSEALEIKARIASFNEKITYAAEVQSTLRELLVESSSHRMELIIIALIAVEVIIAIIREGSELWSMVTGKPAHSRQKDASSIEVVS
ncbi:hypothetical protein Clacol_002382 [Clathrus columnatus]|uniref:DUF155 domain-containing protein n=1 Tax=Clathrus columnatus TaxID=1419009 RepID=A0AAV5A0P0_9AGAM|nr:hypothetical protein Clacol_002382 [Clathrus columnatus]